MYGEMRTVYSNLIVGCRSNDSNSLCRLRALLIAVEMRSHGVSSISYGYPQFLASLPGKLLTSATCINRCQAADGISYHT